MKRFLLSSLLLLAMGRSAYSYENDAVVQVPTMNPELIQIDDPVFINNGLFDVDMTLLQLGGEAPILYETSSTLNFTNTGVMASIPGFDFENFPTSVGQARMMANFVNTANGLGGGIIAATNIFFGLNIFENAGTFSGEFNFDLTGLATIRVRATNVVNNGLMSMDSTGLIDILGNDVNLDHSRFLMTGGTGTGGSGINILDSGSGGFGTNSSGWIPAVDLVPPFVNSPIFTNATGLIEQMSLFNATAYMQDTNPPIGANNTIVWRVIFLQDNSPPNVTANVFFGNLGFDAGAFHIQWTGTYRDPFTGQQNTNFFVFSDVPENRRSAFFFQTPGNISDFSFAESPTPLITGPPVAPSYISTPFSIFGATNDFSYISGQPTALSVGTNQVENGDPTNLPGRIQLTGQTSLNLANVHISGDNYLSLTSPVNYQGNSNSMILAPIADLNLGVTNGSLTLSNLLSPELPAWTGADGAPTATFTEMGGLQAFSGSYFFVSTNLVGTNLVTVTNDVRVLIVNSALQPTIAGFQKNVSLHAPSNLTIADQLNITTKFFSDTTTLTITTNVNSAYSLVGALNILSPDIFLSGSLPNLQFMTNWGRILTLNLANFAGNMVSPFSLRSGATPIQAFVNNGTITNQGIFVLANYFENSGLLQESPSGNIDINVGGPAIFTNSTLLASNGTISIAASSLFVSNNIFNADRSLTLTPSCFLSDGYVFVNQFGHATNATLPNVVTNGNIFTVNGGVRVTTKPATGDLLGTTITNTAFNSLNSVNEWVGEDRGASPSGFAENIALGRMVFVTDANPSQFSFVTPGGNNALYVDTIELQGAATNTDAQGNYTAFSIQPGMKIYFAQALANGASIAEKLNGKNGGGFLWVSNYAGAFSSTNLNGTLFNEALVISPNIDSDGDGTVNRDDATPIPAGLTFDITNLGPQPCTGTDTNTPPPPPPPTPETPDTLRFPTVQNGASGGTGAALSFALAQGTYEGLFYETNGVGPASSGFFTAKVTSKGSLSAKLLLGTKTYSFSGSFSSSGNYTTLTGGKGLAPLNVVLHLVNNDEIVGSVSGTGWTAQLMAVTKAPAAGAGKHSLVLSSDDGSITPSGDSFGTMTLSKSGDIQWSGVLPDGRKVSQKSGLSKDGIWPLYSSLYDGSGSLIGWMQLTNGNADIGGSAVWIVPASQNALYPKGLTNKLDATGSSVNTAPAVSKNTMILSGPQMTSPLTNSVTISGKTGRSEDKSLTLSVDVKNGLFNGSVVDPNSGQTLSFQGALVEKSGIGGGFFLNANKDQGGKVYLAPAN